MENEKDIIKKQVIDLKESINIIFDHSNCSFHNYSNNNLKIKKSE